jgi:hypothetical protein
MGGMIKLSTSWTPSDGVCWVQLSWAQLHYGIRISADHLTAVGRAHGAFFTGTHAADTHIALSVVAGIASIASATPDSKSFYTERDHGGIN